MNLMQILTNENPILINLFAFFVSIAEWLFFYETSVTFFPIASSKRRILFFVFINGIISGVANLLPNSLVSDVINIAQFIISMHFIFRQKILKCFLSLILSYICALTSGFISQLFFSRLLNIPTNNLIPISYIISYILSLLIWYLLIVIIRLIIQNKKTNAFRILPKNFIGINLVFGIITITIESYILSIYLNILPLHLSVLIILPVILYFLISMYSISRTKNLEKTKEDLDNARLYNQTLSILHDNIRGFKHDFNNIVQAIGGYVALNDMNGLKKYYEKLLEECKLTNNLNLLNPETINNPSIYSLLTNKYFIASEKSLTMNFSIFSDLSGLSTNMYEISRILGILLDNAIEAAEETEDKIINIEIKSDDKKHIFIIKNSCKDTNISTTKIFEKGYSTKNRDSGFGLWNVHKILEKNTNLDLFTSIDGNMFSQKFTIYK